MIILFTYKAKWLDIIDFIIKHDNGKYIILTKFVEKYFKKARVIIPFGTKSQKKLHEYTEYRHKFLTNDKEIYNAINDKIRFYDIIKKYDLLNKSDIKLIETYESNYQGPDKHGKFIIKHRKGIGSISNQIVEGNLYDLIKQYSYDHQIQDLLDVDYISGVNCLCSNGSVISAIDFCMQGFITNDYYNQNNLEIIREVDNRYMSVISRIIEVFRYSGFIEIEFLVDRKGDVYLMEANPRATGCIKSKTLEDQAPYITNLIKPYCNLINKKHIKLINYGKQTDIIFYGESNEPLHVVMNGVVKFFK
jgi:predicted ATP-grasp superfamily ATP-dependent carboligase